MRRLLMRFTLLLPDAETARTLGSDQERLRQEGPPITFADAWIAAAGLAVKRAACHPQRQRITALWTISQFLTAAAV